MGWMDLSRMAGAAATDTFHLSPGLPINHPALDPGELIEADGTHFLPEIYRRATRCGGVSGSMITGWLVRINNQ
jgi:hypothetical protein